MCGIFGYVGYKENAPDLVLAGLKELEYRGYDSWGVAAVPAVSSKFLPAQAGKVQSSKIQNTKIVVKKKTGKIGNATVDEIPESTFAFGHTRWATHGGVTEVNAHPHLDCTRSIAVIHNGIIENYEEIKKKLIAKGHRFISETDTEVLTHLIEEYGKTMMFSKAAQKAFLELAGLNAFIAMNASEHTFVAARNGSPLVIGYGVKENFLASDASALIPHTRRVHFLEDGEMAIVSEKGVMVFDARTGDFIHPKKQELTWTVTQAEKGKFADFTLKEIHEQPGILTEIAVQSSTHTAKIARVIKKSYGTYFVGCGTASYACLAATYLFSKIARTHVNWAIGSEFGYHLDFLTDKSLVIALSQSGETMDILESIKKAKHRGTKILALVNVLGSSLYRLADYKVLLGAGPEKAVASTKAFTAKIAHLTLLSYALAGDLAEGRRVVLEAAGSARSILAPKNTEHIRKLARLLSSQNHLFVIGRGLSYPASLEAALKIKELSYIHAEGLAAGELKHGPLALVTNGTPCIAFLPNDETYAANLAGAMEMKARGGYIIGLSPKHHDVMDFHIPVADAREATIIPNVVAIQLLAYYLTIERGLDPDKPRNLAKSVTVK